MATTLLPPASPVRTATREVLDPTHLREALRINPADATLAASLRCGAAVGLALLLAVAAGRPDLAGFAALGALSGLYGRFDPYRRRSALVVAVGLTFVGAFALMSVLAAAATPAVVIYAIVAIVAGAATIACTVVKVGAPGPTIAIFILAGAVGGPVAWDTVPEHVVACAAGAAVAWVVVMSGYLVRPSAPAQLAVRRATDAVRRATADGAPGFRTAAARASIAHARTVLADDLSHRRTRAVAEGLALDVAELATLLDDAVPTADVTAAVAALPARRTLREELREGWRTPGWRLPGLRVTVASAVAGGIALLVGLPHAAWAQMGATATLQGDSTRHHVVRALQRGTGTVLGALLAWPLLAAHLSFAVTCLVVVALQIVTEMLVGRHYGLAMLTITPMALLMTSLGGALDPAGTASSRALDTLIGAVVGVLAVILVHARRAPAVTGPATPASR